MDIQMHLNSDTVDQCSPELPLCLAPETLASDALLQMKDRNHAAVLICEGETLAGIFTERDALHMMAAKADFNVPLSQVMTRHPVALTLRDTVADAVTKMSQNGYRRLPIVDDRRRPIGIIKVESILHYLVEHVPQLVYNLPPEPHYYTHEREGA